ncbi:hypothetical protein Lepto7376_1286 [[Leptolyngbya] sp. PCC 7376]|uniref:hypothetical protein n=1 Tax=[Leptolyngbya] sp. PCC 7376 TaxID=111781 RepID=UPI00029EE1A6|nr:hypothetical protein [[Leptolyngbya] sp. PCC 7376]AFY37639.1 hypothetical protein Lepto7376_1286 [[Leptolyngbya] sp. PCC 7376]
MNIFEHELNAYKTEIINLKEEHKPIKEIKNLTHHCLSISNRGNCVVIGLCALIEAFLLELVNEEEKKNPSNPSNGNGLKRHQDYLSQAKRIDFGKISRWSSFKHIYDLRNALIHSYGGLIETRWIKKVDKAAKLLKVESSIISKRRIRLTTDDLLTFHKIIEELFYELQAASDTDKDN